MRERKFLVKKSGLDVLKGILSKDQAVQLLGGTRRTVNPSIRRYLGRGLRGSGIGGGVIIGS